MKKRYLVIFSLLLSFPYVVFGAEGSPAPQGNSGERKGRDREEAKKIVVAKVNGSDITMEAVLQMIGRIKARGGHGASAPGDQKEIAKTALDRLIFQELAYQKAKSAGVIDEKDVDAAVANAKKNAGGEEEYRKLLEKENMTDGELRVQVERKLAIERLYTKEVTDKVAVTEQEVKEAYGREKGKFVVPEKVSVDDVVFFLNPDEEDSMEKAEEIRGRINADIDKDPWKLVPDGTFIVQDLVVRKGKEKEIYEAAKKIRIGEVSGVIKSPDSLHIIKLKEYTPEKQFAFEEVRGMIEGKLKAEAEKKRLNEWETELKKGAMIEIIETRESKE